MKQCHQGPAIMSLGRFLLYYFVKIIFGDVNKTRCINFETTFKKQSQKDKYKTV